MDGFPEAGQQPQEPVLQVLGLPRFAALPARVRGRASTKRCTSSGAGLGRIQPEACGPPGQFLAQQVPRLFHERGQRNGQVQEPSRRGLSNDVPRRALEEHTVIFLGHAQVAHAVIVAAGTTKVTWS